MEDSYKKYHIQFKNIQNVLKKAYGILFSVGFFPLF
nr:MAG TPA: hypothetical protein [Caudoviricetes sp.]